MPAEPIAPEEQAEIETVVALAVRVEKRGSYTTPFGEALAVLNGVCARIFNRKPEPEEDGPQVAGSEGW
jgi:hypothetical protein